MEITYATTNAGKVASLQRACDEHGWHVRHVKLDIPELRSSDVGEIARHKVTYAYENVKNSALQRRACLSS